MAERLTTKPGETDESVGNAENASKDDADVNMDNMNVSNMNVNGSQDDNSGIKVKSKTDMKGNSDAIQRDDMSSASSLSLVPSPSPSLSTRLPRLDHPSVDYFQFSFQFSLWMFQSNLLHSAASQYDTGEYVRDPL